jgi:hypothetical protein
MTTSTFPDPEMPDSELRDTGDSGSLTEPESS